MAYKTFAAIDIGSYELGMKIFEISSRKGLKEIDYIRHRIELGTDSYFSGKISFERVDELCRLLREFTAIMEGYKVDAYKAYGTSAIRETENTLILLDQIRMRTGIQIDILTNSEQRFLDYKSVASKGERFREIIDQGTAIVDIGGGSIQISLFDNDTLVTTQNIRPGVLRMREELGKIQYQSKHLRDIAYELVDDQLLNFKRMFMEGRNIKNIVLVDDYMSLILNNEKVAASVQGTIEADAYRQFSDSLNQKSSMQMAEDLGIPEENASLLQLSAIVVRRILDLLDAKQIWAPGVSLCDGIAYEYAEENQLMKTTHNFEEDILASARNVNHRYMGSIERIQSREENALMLFDTTRKINGLSKRDRLLLQIACILSESGKYISLSNVGDSSYSIIMATEVIGLSHIEREIVANVVKYMYQPFEYYKILNNRTSLEQDDYLRIAKLTAIMRLADSLNISNRNKRKTIKTTLHDNGLLIQVQTAEEYTLEYGQFDAKASFFEEVFNVKPYMKWKKGNK